jgi:hypothetical protein
MRNKRENRAKERRIEGGQHGVPCVQTLALAKVTQIPTRSPTSWLEARTNSSESNERTGNVYEKKGES